VILDRFRLDGKVGVVTGVGPGVGRGVAVGLAEAGADVVVGARTQADLEEVVRLIEATGRRGLAVVTDVMQAADRDQPIGAAVAAFGRPAGSGSRPAGGRGAPPTACPLRQRRARCATGDCLY
jgi:7-alpha-hydroxysteroid dehydrogenase